jgi:hypothetical protein
MMADSIEYYACRIAISECKTIQWFESTSGLIGIGFVIITGTIKRFNTERLFPGSIQLNVGTFERQLGFSGGGAVIMPITGPDSTLKLFDQQVNDHLNSY